MWNIDDDRLGAWVTLIFVVVIAYFVWKWFL